MSRSSEFCTSQVAETTKQFIDVIHASSVPACYAVQSSGAAWRPQLPDRHGRRRGAAAGEREEVEHASGQRRAAAGALQGPAIRRLARGPRHLPADLQVPPPLRPVLLVRRRQRHRRREAAQSAGMV
jgi:hypothetical protein